MIISHYVKKEKRVNTVLEKCKKIWLCMAFQCIIKIWIIIEAERVVEMKRLGRLLAAFCAAVMVTGSVNVYAYTDAEFKDIEMLPAEGFYTVITDVEGDTHTYDGVIDAKSIEGSSLAEKIASYKIYENDEQIISVELNDIISDNNLKAFGVDGQPVVNGYYSVKFVLSEEDNTEVFLTGLSDSNLDMVQEELIGAKLAGTVFSMESLDFIDAEKTDMPGDGDNELCWAAAAANILHYTGWGQKAGFSSPDALLDLFADSFTDVPGNGFYGLEWFFNGTYTVQGYDNWSQVKEYGTSGKYLEKYDIQKVEEYISVGQNHRNINEVMTGLEAGSGAQITISWLVGDGLRMGGHAITLWGYICDKDYDINDAEYYTGLIVSDSDSDMQASENRRSAPNKLCVLNMSPFTDFGYDAWRFDDFHGGVLEDFLLLKPYSDDIEYETDVNASLDRFTSADLTVKKLYISNDSFDKTGMFSVFTPQDNIYVVPRFENVGLVGSDSFDYNIKATDKADNSVIFNRSYTYNNAIEANNTSLSANIETADIGTLPVGEYTFTVTANPERTADEAYFYNNTKTSDVKVMDRSCDVSALTFNAALGEFTDGKAAATFTYGGLDTLDILNSPDTNIYIVSSHYLDGKWNEWEINHSAKGGADALAALPENCDVQAYGEKVRFRIIIEAVDGSEPVINLYSDELDLSYAGLTIAADEANTYDLTNVGLGEKKFADGEQLAFRVKNISTYDAGELTCNAVVYAKQGDEKIELFRKDNVSAAYGGTSDIISFNSWNKDLSGSYDIVAVAEGDYYCDEAYLGKLNVHEQPSFVVNTYEDVVNAYDCNISLREAVSYIEQYGTDEDKITINEDIYAIYLNNAITVDSSVKISGSTAINGLGQTQIFYVSKNGVLQADNLILRSGKSAEYGGAVENRGGQVYLNNCTLINNNSAAAGGAVYSDGGSVSLKDCTLTENSSGYGAAVALNGGAELDMLNCNVMLNSSNGGAVYNNSGSAVIVYCIFCDNAASSSGGGAITSFAKTDMFGSIACFNGECDVDGKVNVYGSYVDTVSDKVSVDELTVRGNGKNIFMCDAENGGVKYEVIYDYISEVYKAKVSPLVNDGIYVKNIDGRLAYCADNSSWIVTDVPSAFTDTEYTLDITGKAHAGLFGSTAEVCSDISIVSVLGDKAALYTPEPVNAVLIEKQKNGTEFNVYEISLDMGTNFVTVTDADTEGDAITYMLWDSMDNMKPFCPYYMK